VRGWDLASSSKEKLKSDPDYTVGVKLGVRWETTALRGVKVPIIYIADVIYGRWEGIERNNIIRDTAINDGASVKIGIEAFGAYKDAYTELRDTLKGVRQVIQCNLSGDKISKVSPLVAPFEAGNIYFKRASWNDAVVTWLKQFPSASHDDVPDAVAVAFSMHKRAEPLIYTTKDYEADLAA
jgi:predicted phage terminase large subunit-like protein